MNEHETIVQCWNGWNTSDFNDYKFQFLTLSKVSAGLYAQKLKKKNDKQPLELMKSRSWNF